ncbi:serine/threonine-protein kinase [Polyangium jinanense]|uniref:non-specific serine/threonine protein kinase n=1 Tax=Polyangium jinanense TaxID=2829994 RepID=A0A9X3XC53_9BACT|nr:serine/threonine-protein kinase [Polyangium jinanense]MDC3959166.1 serine/threonine protein kinase [Polyangium jinanense]MDC3987614.1 serine/threonine protein kinase [Polyangium jinanense]
MSKSTPPDGPSPSAIDDAVTVPRAERAAAASGEPSAMLISSSALEERGQGSLLQDELASLVGKLISDRYVVHELIGHGGMGAVYRGEQVHLRKRVAIKVLRPDMARMIELSVRFEREAIAGAHVSHPNVVAATDFGKLDDGSQFLILEYVEGTPLKDLIEQGPMPLDRALAISRQITMALGAVHEKSIVHRDVKPQNILVDAKGTVKLLDFGLAKVRVELLSDQGRNAKPSPALTGVGMVMGTFAYMAPEAARGMEGVDARSDLYALGVVMYEMLTGKRPFEESDPGLHLKKIRSEDPPSMRQRAPEITVPTRIEAVVLRLLAREPDRRFASANEVLAALDEAAAAPEKELEKAPEMAPEAAPTKAASAGPKRLDKRALILVAGGLSALAVLLLVVVLLRGGSESQETSAPTASAAPAPSPTTAPESAPTDIDGADATEWAERLRRAASRKEWRPGAKAFLALAKLDPARLTGSELRGDVATVVAGIGFETSFTESDQVFDALENELGSGGLDVLFHVVRTRGGSKASRRAQDILGKPGILDRATPALRVAYELRKSACPDKRALFSRAAEEGDGRALEELLIVKDVPCSAKRDPCCYREDAELKDAISKLRAKLGG